MNLEQKTSDIIDYIRTEVQQKKKKGVVVSLSGGIDSNTSAYLGQRAVGSRAIEALIMPLGNYTKKSETQDAILVANRLKINYKQIDILKNISSIIDINKMDEEDLIETAQDYRIMYVQAYARMKNLFILATHNDSEWFLRVSYETGDDWICPLAYLWKTEVYGIAKILGVPEKIISKPAQDGFGNYDEEYFKATWEQIDTVLWYLLDPTKEFSIEEIHSLTKIPADSINLIQNAFKNTVKKTHQITNADCILPIDPPVTSLYLHNKKPLEWSPPAMQVLPEYLIKRVKLKSLI